MDQLIKSLPDIIKAAAQSQLGILALLVVALAVLAYVFFAKAAMKIRVGIFVLLFAGVVGFVVAMFRASGAGGPQAPAAEAVTVAPARLSPEAQRLLAAAAADPSGHILYEKYGASVDLHANGVSFLTDKGDHRAVATWESALKELVDAGLLLAHGERGEVYEITRKGYDAAGAAAASAPAGRAS